jgi:hypothetical protein
MPETPTAAEAWNAAYPVGQPVRYWPGFRDGDMPPAYGTTSAAAFDSPQYGPVVPIPGSGQTKLTHVEACTEAELVAAGHGYRRGWMTALGKVDWALDELRREAGRG